MTGPPTRVQRGFTLIELLVVMTLLALLMTGLISAMRTMAQTETKIDQRLQRLDDLRTVHSLLSQALSQVSALRMDTPDMPGKAMVPFVATPNSLIWLGILPARPGVGGRHYFRLAVEESGSENVLALRLAPAQPDLQLPNWGTADVHVLLRNVSQLAVQAKGLAPSNSSQINTWPKGWQSGWPVAESLPEQVRLSLSDPTQADLLDWTFSLHAFAQSDSTLSIVTVGGATP